MNETLLVKSAVTVDLSLICLVFFIVLSIDWRYLEDSELSLELADVSLLFRKESSRHAVNLLLQSGNVHDVEHLRQSVFRFIHQGLLSHALATQKDGHAERLSQDVTHGKFELA
jgi:hypothetical protein